MSASALDLCVALGRAQAALRLKLDDELGTLHGIGWDVFGLLETLETEGGSMPMRALPRRVGLPASGVVRMLLPLEKVGLLARESGTAGERQVVLRASGRRVLREARETAGAVCSAALATDAWPLDGADAFLRELAANPALDLR
jgi:DNA-binding MarR family transcriptional regulator